MSPENLSRRAILAGAASVPAFALPAVIATAIPAVATAAPTSLTPAPDPVFALAERVMRTHDAYAAACEACCGAPDKAMTEWRKHNPSPDESAGADEYKAAMARWRRRERAAERRTGYAKADASRDAAGDAAWDAIHALRDAVPATVAGLAAKARAWRYLEKDIKEQADDIVYSLAKDVTIMAGEVDREAVQS